MKKLLLIVIAAVSISRINAQWQSSGPTGSYIYSLAVGSAGVFAGNENGGAYLSSNNGASWVAVDSPAFQSNYVLSMAASGSIVFAGTNVGLYLSINSGATWTPADTGLPVGSRVQTIAISGANVFVGTAVNGIFLSANGGHWTEVNTGLTDTDIYALTVDGGNIFAGTYGGGVFLSTNNGASWTAINNGLTDLHVYAIAVSGANILAGTETGNIFLSNNNGASWTSVFSIEASVTSLAISGSDIYAGTDDRGVFLSTDTGGTWNAENTGLTYQQVYALAISDTTIFAGTQEGGVWQMPIAKQTMSTCTPPAAPVNTTDSLSLRVCQAHSTTLIANGTGTIGWYSASTGGTHLEGGAYFVTPPLDTTTTFYVQDSTCGASLRTAITVMVYPKQNIVLLVSGDTIKSFGAFTSYQLLQNGIVLDTTTDSILIYICNCTTAYGNYEVIVTDTNGCEDTATFSLLPEGIPMVNTQNAIRLYPNPANNSFVIETAGTSGQQMQVFDITGNLLLSQLIQKGKTTVDVSGFAAGVYLVSLKSDGKASTQKLVIAR